MTIEQTIVRTIKLDNRCDKCGVGFYRINLGQARPAVYPPQYVHFCNHCDDRQVFPVSYPLSVQVAEGEEIDVQALTNPQVNAPGDH